MALITVLDAGTLAVDWSALESYGDVRLFPNTPHGDVALIKERCAGAQVVLLNKVPLTREILAALPELKCVCVLATGYNVVDTAAARERGIVVCNVPAYSTDSVAQHTLALLMELTNRVCAHNQSVHRGDWVKCDKFWYQLSPISELAGKTAGIVGFGAIGQKVAVVLHALGMKIMAASRSRKNAPDWKDFSWGSVEEIFESADIVSLHLPQTEETKQMVNAALLQKMKPTAFLINTSRGALINEKDLFDALSTGRLAGAGLDVLCTEPCSKDYSLLGLDNVIITPHTAFFSQESIQELREKIVADVIAVLAGKTPRYQINLIT